jgi:tryptophan halogenase
MSENKLKRVVIAGGGTTGWLTAAALSKQLGKLLDIVLVESDDIGTVGVGEATIPPIRVFHKLLGIDEQEFMRFTSATFKLGISFENWGNIEESYIHSFGVTGKGSYLADFQHFWLRGLREGITAPFSGYCYELQAAKAGRFATSEKSNINYAYHFDATLYAKFLRKFSEDKGITRVEGKISKVLQNDDSGKIASLTLESGQVIEGDLFIDCTGFSALLIEKTMETGYEDWSHWLPCDSAVAVQTKSVEDALPYTRSIAHSSGWRWRIPLQHRVGNGLVFCSKYLSDDEATQQLLDSVVGERLTQPKILKFKTGRRKKTWNNNCIALGLASGFLEPLESTSIHLVVTGILRLMRLFPFGEEQQGLADEFNSQTRIEQEQVRDFIILHYHATQREDSLFWRYCKNMDIPTTLKHRMDVFKQSAHAYQISGELFRVDSWTQVMLGQGILPQEYHHFVDTMNDRELPKFLNGYRESVNRAVEKLPKHQDFITQYCKTNLS